MGLIIGLRIVSLAAGSAFALASSAAFAATVVTARLWDKAMPVTMAPPTGLTYGASGLDLSKATMGIELSRKSAPAGVVTFKVTNSSKDTTHELIVLYLRDPTKPLPVAFPDLTMPDSKGVVSERPGQSDTLTVTLQPGKYLLICDIPTHYAAGMWTEFEVTK